MYVDLILVHINTRLDLLRIHTFRCISCQPEKTTLHVGQSRSWSTEQRGKKKLWQRPHPPPARAARSDFPSFPIAVLALYFVLATWVQPSHPASPRPSSVSGANLVLTHRLLYFLPLSAAMLCCTVLYCTVLYCTPVLMSWPLVRTA